MTSHDDAQKLIDDLSSKHFIDLFKMYGVELVPTDMALMENGAMLYCGIIGFSGQGIRGSLAVAGSAALLEASNPTPGSAPRDWVAEIANQLMGHVKSRLLGYSVEVYMSTPLVVRGERLSMEVRGVVQQRVFTDVAARGYLALWVDVETSPEFQMASEEDTTLSGLDGGSSLMF